MKLHIHGVHVPNRKNTAELAALRLPIPETVEIPMSMHIGAPAIPVVKPGESVRVGQLIGKAGGFVSAPVYASVSGTVKKIGQQVGSGGRLIQTAQARHHAGFSGRRARKRHGRPRRRRLPDGRQADR